MVKPNQLILRCYAEQLNNGQWQAFCLDLTLAAQGDSFRDVHQKLGAMIKEYVFDALAGADKEFAFSLLKRRAPAKYWVKFYSLVFRHKLGLLKNGVARLFCPPIPLEPAHTRA